MSTLVICVDRADDIGRKTGIQTPVSGWEAVQALVTDVGIADPEDSSVNCLLEALRVTRDLRDDDEEAEVAVISGTADGIVRGDRSVARQIEILLETHDVDAAIIVIDSVEDERIVPVIESRIRVDAVDRIVVRQARDIESTYYLLKQFLADEELRQTILVPTGIALLVFPVLLLAANLAVAVAAIAAGSGVFLLYKGLGVDEQVAALPRRVREALYSGQVSVVTYVVAAGLALVGVFAGALGASELPESGEVLLSVMQFSYDAVPWVAAAALAATTGRIVDEMIREDQIRTSYMNMPFGVVALGLVIRGFAAYFLQRAAVIDPLRMPSVTAGVVEVQGFPLSAGERLALFVLAGVLLSLVGVQVAMRLATPELEEAS